MGLRSLGCLGLRSLSWASRHQHLRLRIVLGALVLRLLVLDELEPLLRHLAKDKAHHLFSTPELGSLPPRAPSPHLCTKSARAKPKLLRDAETSPGKHETGNTKPAAKIACDCFFDCCSTQRAPRRRLRSRRSYRRQRSWRNGATRLGTPALRCCCQGGLLRGSR